MAKNLYGDNYFFAEDKIPEADTNNYWESIKKALIQEEEYFVSEEIRLEWQKSCEERVIMNCFNINNAVITQEDEY